MKPKQKIQRVLGKYQRLPNARPGILGNGAGVVDDSRNQGHSYVRIGNSPAISVVNKRCASLNDLPVWVGYDPLEPETLQILSIRSYQRVGQSNVDQSPQVGTHAYTHRWFERDTVFVDTRQMMPFRPLLDGTMLLQVNHGITFLGGMWRGIGDSSIDMSPYVPATGSLYTLVYYGSSGTLQVDVGPVKDLNTLLPSNAPIPTAGTIPVALLRLWSGMSGMYENRTATDLADPRWTGLYGGTGGGTGTSGTGDVIAPGSATPGNLVIFGADPQHIEDGGTLPSGLLNDYICIQDQKVQNTPGGTFTNRAWQTRDLNTEVADDGNHASISANQITLDAGTYLCRIETPAWSVGRHKAKLYNITTSTDILFGSSAYCPYNTSSITSVITGKFVLSTSTVLEIRDQCTDTQASNGFGVESNFGTEIYTTVEFWKIS